MPSTSPMRPSLRGGFYQTAYLKYYYPVEFMAALLTSVIDNPGKALNISSPVDPWALKSSLRILMKERPVFRVRRLHPVCVDRN